MTAREKQAIKKRLEDRLKALKNQEEKLAAEICATQSELDQLKHSSPEPRAVQNLRIATMVLLGQQTIKEAGQQLGVTGQTARLMLHRHCLAKNPTLYAVGGSLYEPPSLPWLRQNASQFLR